MADDAREMLPQDEVVEIPDSGGVLPDPSLFQYYSDMVGRCYWLDEEINSDSLWLVKAIVAINREDAGIPSPPCRWASVSRPVLHRSGTWSLRRGYLLRATSLHSSDTS